MARREGKKKLKMKSGDFVLTILMMGLVVFGIIMVFSASYYVAISDYGNPYYYLIRDSIWAVLGLIAFSFCVVFDYHHYRKFAPLLMILSLIFLALTLTSLGHSVNGAARWLKVGPITFMPGEVAKICAILFTAKYLSDKPNRIRSFKDGVLPMVLLAGAYFGLIMKQPNMSTAITVGSIVVGIMFVAGLNIAYLIGIGITGCVGVLALIFSPGGAYRLKRMTSFMDPFADPLGTGWQVTQSLMALGSGGLFGVGLGKSIQKTLYLPEPQNDFIFAIIGEELGYIGCLILIAVYVVLIWRCAHIALNAPDMFGMLVASGITIMFAVQVMMNIAVVTSSMPPTGIILPFVSFGGNALLLCMASMGIMLNISRHSAQ